MEHTEVGSSEELSEVERIWWRCCNNHPEGWYRHSDIQMWLVERSHKHWQRTGQSECRGWRPRFTYTTLLPWVCVLISREFSKAELESGNNLYHKCFWSLGSHLSLSFLSRGLLSSDYCVTCISDILLVWVGRTAQCDPRTRSQQCLQHCPICCSVETRHKRGNSPQTRPFFF